MPKADDPSHQMTADLTPSHPAPAFDLEDDKKHTKSSDDAVSVDSEDTLV